jgi:STAS-like domain of unknown function (DUF4325)
MSARTLQSEALPGSLRAKGAEHVILRVRDYTRTPGGRTSDDGLWPGVEFLTLHLLPAFERAEAAGTTLLVDLDGTASYASSFLDEAFAGLTRIKGQVAVRQVVRIKSNDEPYLEDDIWQYVSEAD